MKFFWIIILPILAIGATMKGCDSYSSGCTLPDIPTETLVIYTPKQFLDENPTYVTSVFSSDSDKALENHQAMMARFDETHGKIMLALQSGCTSSDEVNRLIATSNELTVQSMYIPADRIQHSQDTSGRFVPIPWAIVIIGSTILGFLQVADEGNTCAPQPPSGVGVSVDESIKQGASLSTILDGGTAELDSFSELVSLIFGSSGDQNGRAADLTLSALLVNDHVGPYLASSSALTQMLVYESIQAGTKPTFVGIESNCEGWNDVNSCGDVIDEANKLAWYTDFSELLIDGYMPILGPIPTEANDETTSRSCDYCGLVDLVNFLLEIKRALDGLENWPSIPGNDFGPGFGATGATDLDEQDFTEELNELVDEIQDEVSLKELRKTHSADQTETSGRVWWVIAEGVAKLVVAYFIQDGITDFFGGGLAGPGNSGSGNGYIDSVLELAKANPNPSVSDFGLALQPDANGDSDEKSALLVELLSLDADGAYLIAAESEFAQESCTSDHTHATSGRVKHGCTPSLPFWILAGKQTFTPVNNIGSIDIENDEALARSSVNAQLDTYEMLRILPAASDVDPTSETLERLENKFFGTTQASCLIDGGYGVAIQAEASARAGGLDGVLSAYAILRALLEGTTIFTSTGGNTIDVTVDMMLDRETTDDWSMPIWPPGTDPDILKDIERMWAVADVANQWAIGEGLSPEQAHIFAIGTAVIMAYEAGGATMVAEGDTATAARATLPFQGMLWLIKWWQIIRIVSGEDGYTVNDENTGAECWDDDFDYDAKSLFDEELDTDGDGVPNSMETDPDCWNTPVDSKTDEKGCSIVPEGTEGTGDGSGDSTSETNDDDEDDDGFLPGFGFMSTLISLLGVAILLQRKQREDND